MANRIKVGDYLDLRAYDLGGPTGCIFGQPALAPAVTPIPGLISVCIQNISGDYAYINTISVVHQGFYLANNQVLNFDINNEGFSGYYSWRLFCGGIGPAAPGNAVFAVGMLATG